MLVQKTDTVLHSFISLNPMQQISVSLSALSFLSFYATFTEYNYTLK